MTTVKTFIVEDSPVIRDNLIATLEELTPVRVVGTVEDEQAAVDWMSQNGNACDLMIIDVFLKGGTGLGVLRAAQQAAPNAVRVVLTNYASVDVRRRCTELGAAKVFDKSSELEELISYCSGLGEAQPAEN